jgi:hypothetical protein
MVPHRTTKNQTSRASFVSKTGCMVNGIGHHLLLWLIFFSNATAPADSTSHIAYIGTRNIDVQGWAGKNKGMRYCQKGGNHRICQVSLLAAII